MPVAVNEVVCNTSISLNRAFVFESVNWVRFVLRLKILRERGLLYFGIFEKEDSSQVRPGKVVAS